MIQKQRRQQHGTRKFEKFMEDQIIFQVRRQENLKRVAIEESLKATYTPKITEKSREMIQQRAAYDRPELAAPAHKRLNDIATLSHEARMGGVISPRVRQNPQMST